MEIFHIILSQIPPHPLPDLFVPEKHSFQNNLHTRVHLNKIIYDDYDVYFSADEFNFDNNMTDYEAAVLSASKEAEEEDRILENMFKVKFNNYDT